MKSILQKYIQIERQLLHYLFYLLPQSFRAFFNKKIVFMRNILRFLLIFIVMFIFSLPFLFKNKFDYYLQDKGYQAVIDNYKNEVDKYAKKFNLPSSYLLALIMLESSGRKNAPYRYEPHIYKKLKLLKEGKIKQFENLKPEDLKGFSNSQLKDLASSWGPFQIMGYKTIKMGITIDELKGKNAVYWGIKWINDDYGFLLRQGKFKDAFHWHNTGKPFPRDGIPQTYDENYVNKGLYYMKVFSKLY